MFGAMGSSVNSIGDSSSPSSCFTSKYIDGGEEKVVEAPEFSFRIGEVMSDGEVELLDNDIGVYRCSRSRKIGRGCCE